jgi:hypothetical protein
MSEVPGQMKIPVHYSYGTLPIIKELFSSIITRLEMLAVHVEKALTVKSCECAMIAGQRENDCNS